MKVLRSYLLMMICREVIGEVICNILRSWTPIKNEVFLEDLILYRIESHIYCLGFYLFYSSIGDFDGVGIVGLDGSDRLRVSHFSECDTEHGAVVGVAEEAAGFGFGSRRNKILYDVANGVDGAVGSWCHSGRLCWVNEV